MCLIFHVNYSANLSLFYFFGYIFAFQIKNMESEKVIDEKNGGDIFIMKFSTSGYIY